MGFFSFAHFWVWIVDHRPQVRSIMRVKVAFWLWSVLWFSVSSESDGKWTFFEFFYWYLNPGSPNSNEKHCQWWKWHYILNMSFSSQYKQNRMIDTFSSFCPFFSWSLELLRGFAGSWVVGTCSVGHQERYKKYFSP